MERWTVRACPVITLRQHLSDALLQPSVKFILENIFLIAIVMVSGGLLLWPMISRRAGAAALGTIQATQLINGKNAIVLDVREAAEFAKGSITGARNLPLAALAERLGELTRFKTRPFLVVCESGQRSARALGTLKKLGYADAHNLAGGLAAWKQAGLPLVKASAKDNARPVLKDVAKAQQKSAARQSAKARSAARTNGAGAANEPIANPDSTARVAADDSAKEIV